MSGRTIKATHIGTDTKVAGDVAGDGSLSVAGAIDGDVHLKGDLTVSPSGLIDGDVRAVTVSVDGEVRGKLSAEAAIVGAQATVSGAISSPRITINPRARLNARFDMPVSLPREIGSRR